MTADRLINAQSIFARTSAGDNRIPQLISPNGMAGLTLQTDGNLVLYRLDTPARDVLWSSKTRGGYSANLQKDGNFVVVDRNNAPLWATGTQGRPYAWLRIQNDGNLVMYDGPTTPVWNSESQGFANRQDELGWLANATLTAGRGIANGLDDIADVNSSIADDLAGIPFIGPALHGVFGAVGAPFALADSIADGERIDRAILDNFKAQLANVKEVAPYAQMVIAFVPGIGPLVSGAISGALALASGMPLSDALVDAVVGAIPGGPLVQSAARIGIAAAQGQPISDVAVAGLPIPVEARAGVKAAMNVTSNLANGLPVSTALLNAADQSLDGLDPNIAAAAKIGIALAQGKRLQDLATAAISDAVASGAIAGVGKALLADSPVLQSAMAIVPSGAGNGFVLGLGAMNHQLPQGALAQIRNTLTGDDLVGFDAAIATRIAMVRNPIRLVPAPVFNAAASRVRAVQPPPLALNASRRIGSLVALASSLDVPTKAGYVPTQLPPGAVAQGSFPDPRREAAYLMTMGLQGAPQSTKAALASRLITQPVSKAGAADAIAKVATARVTAAHAHRSAWQAIKEFLGFYDATTILPGMSPAEQLARANLALARK